MLLNREFRMNASHHVSIDTTPQVRHYRDDSEPRSHHTQVCDRDDPDSMVHASFNLQNINAPVPLSFLPKNI